TIAVEKLARDARVLAGDQVHARQNLQGAQRDVTKIADRSRNHVQSRLGTSCCDRLSGQDVATRGRMRLAARNILLRRPPFSIGSFHAATLSPQPQPERFDSIDHSTTIYEPMRH